MQRTARRCSYSAMALDVSSHRGPRFRRPPVPRTAARLGFGTRAIFFDPQIAQIFTDSQKSSCANLCGSVDLQRCAGGGASNLSTINSQPLTAARRAAYRSGGMRNAR